ncbi:MAG: metallophosphoesterase [Phycisphaerales bacterium JB065]
MTHEDPGQSDPPAIPIDRADLWFAHLPAALQGFTILQISDTHVSAGYPAARRLHDRLIQQLRDPDAGLGRIDLAVLTGDYMCRDGDEHIAAAALGELIGACDGLARHACLGIFGNHDHAELKEIARARAATGEWPIRWMNRRTLDIEGMQVIGSDWPESFPPSASGRPSVPDDGSPFRLAILHTPDATPLAHRAGAHLVLAGHTHGGQLRLPLPGGGVFALYTSSDLIPRRAPAGVYRYLDPMSPRHAPTTLAVTRGIGFQGVPRRLWCPPQIALYTLRRGESEQTVAKGMPPEPVGSGGELTVVRVW